MAKNQFDNSKFKEACKNSGLEVLDHFPRVEKLIDLPTAESIKKLETKKEPEILLEKSKKRKS